MTTIIRRYVETDTGHRVPNHTSKCQHLHGHRYRFEVEVEGETINEKGRSDEGMLIDFSDITSILNARVHDVIDHALVLFEGDPIAKSLQSIVEPHHRIVLVPFIPTAENLAKWAYEQVEPDIIAAYNSTLKLKAMHCRETPKSWASWIP